MDPLSIVASTLTLTAVVSNTLQAVERLHRLPSKLRELLQETTDLALVLHHVEILLNNDAAANSPLLTTQPEAQKLAQFVERLHMVLSNVDSILKKHVIQQPAPAQDAAGKSPDRELSNTADIASLTNFNNTKDGGPQQKIKVSWISGHKALTSLSKLREDLKSTKQSLILILTLIAGARSTGLEHMLQEFFQFFQTSTTNQAAFHRHATIEMRNQAMYLQRLQEKLDALEQTSTERSLLRTQKYWTPLGTSNQLPGIGRNRAVETEQSSLSRSLIFDLPNAEGQTPLSIAQDTSWHRKLDGSQIARCPPTCVCICHAESIWSTSPILKSLSGVLIIHIVAPRFVRGKCSEKRCLHPEPPGIEVQYIFPFWLLWMSLALTLRAPSPYRFDLNIRATRIRPDTSLIFRYAKDGNVDAIRDLFDRGLASPFDVDDRLNSSALMYATGWLQPKACEMLLDAGADIYSTVVDGYSPILRVWQCLLIAGTGQKRFSKSATSLEPQMRSKLLEDMSFKFITKNDIEIETFWDRRHLPIFHQIVLGLSSIDLEKQLELSTAEIDAVDDQGLTALCWAANTGNALSIELLLQHGADVNKAASNGCGPLHFATLTIHPGCIEPLLRYGAKVDAQDLWGVTPLHVSTMSRDDFQHAVLLLDAKVDIDISDNHGTTALYRAVRFNRPKMVAYLLQNGARLLEDKWGMSPLDIAVESSYHEALDAILTWGGHLLTEDNRSASLQQAEKLHDWHMVDMLKHANLQVSHQSPLEQL